MRDKKFSLIQLVEYMKEWDDVNCELFPLEKKEKFLNRKKAVELYSNGATGEQITSETGVRCNKVSGYIERCLRINPDTGRQYGFAALIPNRKTVRKDCFTVDSADKGKGAFERILNEYPELKDFITDLYTGNKNVVLEKNMSVSHMHLQFLSKCRQLKLSDSDYPFNTKDKAKRSFYKYIENLRQTPDMAVVRENKNAIKKFKSTGIGMQMRNRSLIPFSVVQLDGHKIDMLYSVQVTNDQGETLNMVATRMWLIAVIDVATRAVLGYSLTSNENYNQFDVLAALRNSIIPKARMKFTLNGIKYPENGGFPSLAITETQWALPNVIMLDNAKSHLAGNTQNKLVKNLFCSLNFGSVATPETRGIVERMFGRLEKDGYHRIVSTTGSNVNDIKRGNPEKDAAKYAIRYDDIVQLTEYFIAVYNNSPHSALNNETPLECMERRLIQDGMKPCIADADMKKKVYELTNITEVRTIRGNEKSGRRPYITFKGVEYRNDILSQSIGLIGKKLILDVNPDDISNVKGYFEDGTSIGILTAVGEWGRRSHSLNTRNGAIRLSNYNKSKNNNPKVDLTEFENDLKERAKTERRARTKAARIQRDANTKDNRGNKGEDEETVIKNGKSNKKTKEKQAYTEEEIAAIMDAESFEAAYENGLL